MQNSGNKAGKAIEGAGQAGGALVGTAIGGPVGGAIGAFAGPYLTTLVERAWNEIRGQHEDNAVAVVAHAAQSLDENPDALVQRALANPNQASLLHDALRGAASTLYSEKVAALGRCLANGLEDEAVVDQESLIVRALADLEPIHVRVLGRLEQSSLRENDIHDFMTGGLEAEQFMTTPNLTGPVLAVLERHALVERNQRMRESQGVYSRGATVEERWATTAFGRACLRRLGHPDPREQGAPTEHTQRMVDGTKRLTFARTALRRSRHLGHRQAARAGCSLGAPGLRSGRASA